LFAFFDSWYLPVLRDVPLDVGPSARSAGPSPDSRGRSSRT
jgi:hypothetical protein